MNNLSSVTKVYILSTILIGMGLVAWVVQDVSWTKPGLYTLAVLAA
jgi:hypothetical protein